jgi:exodeoxyribonuclease VII large subunit
MQRLDELQARALAAMRRENRARADGLRRLRAELAAVSPAARLTGLGQRARHAEGRLAPSLRHVLALTRGRLHAALRGLQATSPLATLDRGYAIVTRAEGGVVRDPVDAPPGTDIEARLARGTLRARVIPARS